MATAPRLKFRWLPMPILLLQASHFDSEDLYHIESEPAHWRERLSELDATIFTCIKLTRIRRQSTVSQSEN